MDGDPDPQFQFVSSPLPECGQLGGPIAHRHREPYGLPGGVVDLHGVVEEHEHAVAGDNGVHLFVPRIHIDGVIGIEKGHPVAHAAL